MSDVWFAGVTAFAMMTGAAFAQSPDFNATNSTQPTMSTNGPAGTYDRTKTEQTIDGNGTATHTSESFDKSQTYTSQDGDLSARTHISTTGPTRITPLSPAVSTSTSTKTTTETQH